MMLGLVIDVKKKQIVLRYHNAMDERIHKD